MLPRGGGGGWGVLGGLKLKKTGITPNGRTNWHQIWHTWADSSGNGHRLKQLAHRDTKGGGALGGGGLGGHTFKHLDNLPNGWTNWHQIWRIHLGMDIG